MDSNEAVSLSLSKAGEILYTLKILGLPAIYLCSTTVPAIRCKSSLRFASFRAFRCYPAAIELLNIYSSFEAEGLEEHRLFEGKAFEELQPK